MGPQAHWKAWPDPGPLSAPSLRGEGLPRRGLYVIYAPPSYVSATEATLPCVEAALAQHGTVLS